MDITIQNIIEKLTKSVPELRETVDMLTSGKQEVAVSGIATTFIATHNVIRKAIELNVNLLITHEGIYYSHHGKQDQWLNDPVYLEKKRLIEQSQMAIFRFHDTIHLYQPDGIMLGLLRKLNWEPHVVKHHTTESILTFPPMGLGELAKYVKKKLNIPYVRVVGDLSLLCERIGISVGYRGGGENAIPLYQREQLDLLITGEGPEWETPEYVRDALQQGRNRGLILLGHAESEKAGMEYLAEIIQSMYPRTPVHFIDEKPVFQMI
ncbi:Nif3-like dinuclear metal center hexameric protein [Lederbergia galactosidilytica]|uniref:GTP cyclohydrolase 1 type 2 homolog n=1 Tax=Lederbergia galactosidilytica TaxID=217031 RepID=A0A177ZK04_9BACI|nr:Nif3-like dinuclear metal center hexameric protein [Lederbergia galactosidilytica]OAK67228.1 transcriptional regulator [Lederbergia galactosidilytica]